MWEGVGWGVCTDCLVLDGMFFFGLLFVETVVLVR